MPKPKRTNWPAFIKIDAMGIGKPKGTTTQTSK